MPSLLNPKHPASLWLNRLKDMLNPVYHFRRLIEDLAVTRKAFKFRQAHRLEDHDMLPEELLRGRLAAAFFMSGPFGLISIPLGYWTQRMSNPGVGMVVTVLTIMIVTSAVYQIIWYRDNRVFYKHLPTVGQRFRALQDDLWPVHWTGIKTGTILGVLSSYWAILIVMGLLKWLLPNHFDLLPHNLLLLITDFVFVQGPFLRIMGDFFDRHSKRLAHKYEWAFTE